MNAPRWADRPIVVLGARGMLGTDLVACVNARLGVLSPSQGDDRGKSQTHKQSQDCRPPQPSPSSGNTLLRHGSGHESEGKAAAWVLAWDKEELDITDAAAVEAALSHIAPGVVMNCAAYTDVDGCESNIALATAINAKAPGFLGRACRKAGATLVHVGTDFIFDGRSRRPYGPEAPANPLSAYGRSKWEGEEAVRASACHYLIVRTSWLYGLHGRNFVEAILQKAEAGQVLRVVNDQVGRPTYTMDLSAAIVALLDVEARGVVHAANEGQCSWHSFAEAIVELAGLSAPVAAISSAELNRPAERPAYSVLDLSGYQQLTGRTARPWREALAEYLIRRRAKDAAKVRGAANLNSRG